MLASKAAMERLGRAIAFVATVMVVGSFGWMLLTSSGSSGGLLGFETPSIALEILEEPNEVAAVLGGEDGGERAALRHAVDVDFAVIGAYWLLFVLLAAVLGRRMLPGARLMAVAVVVAVTMAAVLDVVENFRLYRVLAAPGDPHVLRELIEPARRAAVGKWAALFTATALVSPVFYGFDDEVLYGFGLLFVCTGLVGLAGVAWYPPAVEWAFGLLGVSLLVVAGLFLWEPDHLVEDSA